jgi:hypothetical protein
VDDAIEDGVGEGWLADDFVPFVEGELAGDEGRAIAIAILDDFHQIAPLVGGEPVWSPVVEDQQIGFDQGTEEAGKATVPVGELQIGEQPRHAGVEHRVAVPARLLGERARQPRLADAAWPGDEQIAMLGDPIASRELLEQRLVEPSRCAVVDVLDGRLAVAQLGAA